MNQEAPPERPEPEARHRVAARAVLWTLDARAIRGAFKPAPAAALREVSGLLAALEEDKRHADPATFHLQVVRWTIKTLLQTGRIRRPDSAAARAKVEADLLEITRATLEHSGVVLPG